MQGAATDPWTSFLNTLGSYVSPDWGGLVGLIPFAVIGLIVVVLLVVAWVWYASGPINRDRVPKPRPAGSPPYGVHAPSPSRWPFLLPIGAAFILFGIAVRPEGQVVNWPAMGVGILIAVVALAGWYRDASREWRRVEGVAPTVGPALGAGVAAAPGPGGSRLVPGPAGAAAGTSAAGPAGAASRAAEPPPGVHLPGPSPWPFFVPIGASFVLAGMIFSAAILVGGLLMTAIALGGWYIDAGREWRQVDAGRLPEPSTRDPERAFPRALVGVFAVIAVAALGIALLPTLKGLPATTPVATSAPGGGTAGAIEVVAKDIQFSTGTIQAPAGKPFEIHFTNQDSVPHNIAIFESPSMATILFRGTLVTGPGQSTVYQVPALKAGTYYFHCDVHPTMHGTVVSK